jgi:hypothetical protein
MAKVMISDILVPPIFRQYIQEKTAELSAFFTSGIVQRSPEWDALCNGAGLTVEMPFWGDLDGDDEVLSDSGSLTPGKIGTSKDAAGMNQRGRAWGLNDLPGMLAGSDPMVAIMNRVAAYWARRLQAFLKSFLKGIFSNADMNANIADFYAATGTPASSNFLTGATMIQAVQRLGDAKGSLAALAMHSAVAASLAALDLIDYVPDSTGKLTVQRFMGLEIIQDDGMPQQTVNGNTVYHTFLFGKGAIAYGEATEAKPIDGGFGDWYVEYGRVPLAGDTYLINRKRCLMHMRGVRFLNASVAGTSPTNAELELGGNWARVYDPKHIPVVRIRHNIPSV